MTFKELGLRPEIVETLADLGYEQPTPIQARTIPLLLGGSDVIGQAQTGTGKTAAFALPILERIDTSSSKTQALVLTPTRELAIQVAEAIHSYSKRMASVTVQPVYGGASIGVQLRHLKRGVQVVVGTPGRLIDHLDRRSLNLSSIRMLVLDEADEMLRMGFIEDVERILSEVPDERQIALFSATMPPEVVRIAKTHLHDPERVEIEHRSVAAPAIEQRFLNVSEHQKLTVLTQILELEPSEAVLVFRRTKLGAAELAEKLEARGFAAVALHGDMTQGMREAVVRKLRAGQVEVVVATDVAARGLDVEKIEHVINYDIPHDVEAYVHRIGRTGRAGRTGMATLFVTPRERRMMREIEKFTKSSIAPMKMPTQADVVARRITQLRDNIRAEIKSGDLELYLQLVEQLVDEGTHDIAEVAAAAARLASGSTLAAEAPTPLGVGAPAPTRGGLQPTAGRGRPQDQKKERRPSPSPSEERAQLMIGIGRKDGIRPADVVGSIANEADVPGSDIGPIDIRDDFTLVTIPERFRKKVMDALHAARFKGKRFEIRDAADHDRQKAQSKPRTARTKPRDEKTRPSTKAKKTRAEKTSAKPFYKDLRKGKSSKKKR